MGAATFEVRVVTDNETAQQAFQTAVAQARHEHGHGGYTGTIAEKGSFVHVATAPNWEQASQMADPDAPAVEDKWGPAGCIKVAAKGGKVQGYLFYGWASE